MRNKNCLYGFYTLLFLIGALIGWLLQSRCRMMLTLPLIPGERGAGVLGVLSYYCHLMYLPLILFCAGFTLFAPLVSGGCAMVLGAAVGSGSMAASFAEADVRLIGARMLLALVLTLCILLCGQATAHRLFLRTAAPSPGRLLRCAETRGYISFFFLLSAILLAVSAMAVCLRLAL